MDYKINTFSREEYLIEISHEEGREMIECFNAFLADPFSVDDAVTEEMKRHLNQLLEALVEAERIQFLYYKLLDSLASGRETDREEKQ